MQNSRIMSDSDDDVQAKKSKPSGGVRGRRGFSKKKSVNSENNIEILASSAVYTTRVTKCFNDITSHKINDDLKHILADNIVEDVEEEVLCPTKAEKTEHKNTKDKNKRTESAEHNDVLELSDEEENNKNTVNQTLDSDLNNSAVKSRSPTPPPSPPGRRPVPAHRRMRRNVKKAVATLTHSLSAAENQLKDAVQFATPGRDVCVIDDDEEDVTVRVDIVGKIHRFVVLVQEPFSYLVEKIAAMEKVDPRNVMIVHNDRTIRPTDNPQTIGLQVADIIKCHIRSSCNDSFNESYSFETDEANLIEIVVQSRVSRQKEIVKTLPDRPLKSVMKEYSDRINKDLSCMKFWFDGEVIHGNSTPSDLDMEDGDILDLQLL